MRTIGKVTAAMIGLLICGSAHANPTNPGTATENNSVGSSDLSVTIPVLYRISGIQDLTTANYSDNTSSVSLQMNDDVCIYTNAAAGDTYKIKVKGSSTCSGVDCPGDASDALAISNDNNDQYVPYTVYWNDETGVSSANRQVIGTKGGAEATIASNQSGASRDPNCVPTSGTNANFEIDFLRADILGVKSGAYTGTLTITLLPPT